MCKITIKGMAAKLNNKNNIIDDDKSITLKIFNLSIDIFFKLTFKENKLILLTNKNDNTMDIPHRKIILE